MLLINITCVIYKLTRNKPPVLIVLVQILFGYYIIINIHRTSRKNIKGWKESNLIDVSVNEDSSKYLEPNDEYFIITLC